MEENKEFCPVCDKKKERAKEEREALGNRLSRVEGQIRGIKAMLEKDAYCVDILTQVSAATSALNSFAKVLLSEHIKTCVATGIKEGNDEIVDELLSLLQKMMSDGRK